MAPDARILSLVDAVAARRLKIEHRAEALVVAEFERFGGWYSPRQVEGIAARVADVVAAGQLSTAQLTDAYLARVASYMTHQTVVGVGVPQLMGATLRNGVTGHVEVYTRVAAEYRRRLSEGADPSKALGAALARARSMVSTDLALAMQHQSGVTMARLKARQRLNYYRRIIRPEASQGGTCGLCAAASDRIYWRGDLLPLHARCKCLTIPVMGRLDPGSQINTPILESLYSAAGGTTYGQRVTERGQVKRGLKRVEVTVEEHGELGPQLRVAGQHFRGPDEIAA